MLLFKLDLQFEKEKGYQSTKKGEIISYRYAKDIQLQ